MRLHTRSAVALALFALLLLPLASAQEGVSPAEVRAIGEEAYIYAFPLVMNYGTLYEYFIEKAAPAYKAPINQLYNTARVYTPQDTTIVTPNSDTPYSFVCMDLRAEPYVLSIPKIEKSRYYSVQLVDMYTFNYGYIGSRATGNEAGSYLVVGPTWKGETPAGIAKVFRCETDFTIAIIRTQLFNPGDLENVKQVQAGYRGQTLSAFLKRPAPAAATDIHWPKVDKALAASDPFAYFNFVLQFCPATGPAAVEQPMRDRFAKIGISAGKPFPLDKFSAAQKEQLKQGIEAAVVKIKQHIESMGKNENGWRVTTSGFGDRAMYQGNWTMRAGAAMAGIYGNDAVEALYPMLSTDSAGQKPDCSKSRYTLTFPAGQLPPVNAFWSVTMYDGKTQLLVENPLNRYLINSPMLNDLQKNADGSLTIYIQKDEPSKVLQANWLPAPDGPVCVVMRLYWPQDSALTGQWKPPAVHAAAR